MTRTGEKKCGKNIRNKKSQSYFLHTIRGTVPRLPSITCSAMEINFHARSLATPLRSNVETLISDGGGPVRPWTTEHTADVRSSRPSSRAKPSDDSSCSNAAYRGGRGGRAYAEVWRAHDAPVVQFPYGVVARPSALGIEAAWRSEDVEHRRKEERLEVVQQRNAHLLAPQQQLQQLQQQQQRRHEDDEREWLQREREEELEERSARLRLQRDGGAIGNGISLSPRHSRSPSRSRSRSLSRSPSRSPSPMGREPERRDSRYRYAAQPTSPNGTLDFSLQLHSESSPNSISTCSIVLPRDCEREQQAKLRARRTSETYAVPRSSAAAAMAGGRGGALAAEGLASSSPKRGRDVVQAALSRAPLHPAIVEPGLARADASSLVRVRVAPKLSPERTAPQQQQQPPLRRDYAERCGVLFMQRRSNNRRLLHVARTRAPHYRGASAARAAPAPSRAKWTAERIIMQGGSARSTMPRMVGIAGTAVASVAGSSKSPPRGSGAPRSPRSSSSRGSSSSSSSCAAPRLLSGDDASTLKPLLVVATKRRTPPASGKRAAVPLSTRPSHRGRKSQPQPHPQRSTRSPSPRGGHPPSPRPSSAAAATGVAVLSVTAFAESGGEWSGELLARSSRSLSPRQRSAAATIAAGAAAPHSTTAPPGNAPTASVLLSFVSLDPFASTR